jgi:hypothetical protein
MLRAVDDTSHWLRVFAYNCLFSSCQIDPETVVNMKCCIQWTRPPPEESSIPVDLPVHACSESFIVVGAKAYIQDWSPMLETSNQIGRWLLTIFDYVVEIDILVP